MLLDINLIRLVHYTDLTYCRYSFSEDDAALMASMGYNTIRLGVLWAGLEPIEGEYNMTYLEQVVECVNTAEKYGLYPVLDMHQDVFNRRFCGNGVPDWVPQPPEFNFPYPIEVEYEVDENGHPSRCVVNMIHWSMTMIVKIRHL